MIVTTSIGGCLGGDDADTSANADPSVLAPATPAEVDENTGGIEGQVLDDAGLPVVKASVGILALNLQTATDESGEFSFSKVEPGLHAIAVQKIGFEAAVRNVDVQKGDVTEVQLTLTATFVPQPYTWVRDQSGLFGCGTSWRPGVVYSGVAVCGVLSFAGESTEAYDKFLLVWEMEEATAQWTGAVFEMFWTSNQVAGQGLSMNWEVEGCSNVGDQRFASGGGNNPIKLVADAEKVSQTVENAKADKSASGCVDPPSSKCNDEGCTVQSRVFSEPDTLGEGSPADIGLTFQQQFDQYWTSFFDMEIPDDYSALES